MPLLLDEMAPISFAINLLLVAGGVLLLLLLWLGWQRYASRAPTASGRLRRFVLLVVGPPVVLGALLLLYLVVVTYRVWIKQPAAWAS